MSRPRGGTQASPLSVRDVVGAALQITARSSLDALTIRAVAAELGVTSPAVHYYLRGREDLLDRVVEAVATQIDVELDAGTDWRDQYVTLVLRMDRTFRRYPGVGARALSATGGTSSAAQRLTETAVGILRRAGFAPQDAVEVFAATFLLFTGWLVARGMAESDTTHPALRAAGDDAAELTDALLERSLRRLL
ncbi:TetR/AcrR family transcriptional regulator [Cryptosporangium aurantiacum]|uniref:Transcriptional regulator, TetR family n=1 Tax=Cryptosporangium aurantiacum TaxID=134849 RepID=A0A1M7PLU5_9ACTN|nr:TetR/AcrR family transcriptional regulator [Cryptosporangium aurantiacum]SHN18218.1 transcriptional regulator, TetR family [Cryptosporangium aurantiacum]